MSKEGNDDGSSTSETYEDSSTSASRKSSLSSSFDTLSATSDPSLTGCQVVDDYLSRRDRRLQALRAARQERKLQICNSVSQTVGSSSLICIEDHPYYLAQQERRLLQLKEKIKQQQQQTLTCKGDDVDTPEEMLEELTSAYQLIHRQRLYLQHLIQQLPLQSGEEDVLQTQSEEDISCESRMLIQQLQSKIIQLQHDKAQNEFELRNRITHDAMRFEERVNFFKTKAEYWQTRSQNEVESHKREMEAAQLRIEELEQRAKEESRRQSEENSMYNSTIETTVQDEPCDYNVERNVQIVEIKDRSEKEIHASMDIEDNTDPVVIPKQMTKSTLVLQSDETVHQPPIASATVTATSQAELLERAMVKKRFSIFRTLSVVGK